MNKERLYTVEELAEEYHLTPAGIYNMRHRGVGPRGCRVGKRVLFPESEVLAWLDSRMDSNGDVS